MANEEANITSGANDFENASEQNSSAIKPNKKGWFTIDASKDIPKDMLSKLNDGHQPGSSIIDIGIFNTGLSNTSLSSLHLVSF